MWGIGYFLGVPSALRADFLDCLSTVCRAFLGLKCSKLCTFLLLRSRFDANPRSSLEVRFSRLLLGFNYISPCVIVSKIRPQPLKSPREQPSTFSAVKLPSKEKPALKRRTGRERASKNLHFPFWDFYISRGQQSVFAAFIRNSPHPWGGLLRGQASRQAPASEEKLYSLF